MDGTGRPVVPQERWVSEHTRFSLAARGLVLAMRASAASFVVAVLCVAHLAVAGGAGRGLLREGLDLVATDPRPNSNTMISRLGVLEQISRIEERSIDMLERGLDAASPAHRNTRFARAGASASASASTSSSASASASAAASASASSAKTKRDLPPPPETCPETCKVAWSGLREAYTKYFACEAAGCPAPVLAEKTKHSDDVDKQCMQTGACWEGIETTMFRSVPGDIIAAGPAAGSEGGDGEAAEKSAEAESKAAEAKEAEEAEEAEEELPQKAGAVASGGESGKDAKAPVKDEAKIGEAVADQESGEEPEDAKPKTKGSVLPEKKVARDKPKPNVFRRATNKLKKISLSGFGGRKKGRSRTRRR